jgi:putative transposase
MEGCRKSPHATYQCKYHFVWAPKHRFRVLKGEVKEEPKKIMAQICENMDIEIIRGAYRKIMHTCIYQYLQDTVRQR